jgi:AraC family transcriptional regulator of adaptative response / DNA-3-methyladenine glycosylase II
MSTRDELIADHGACYRALAAHDARFDGCVFVGCTTTRIYCRPICRVRLPRESNVKFFPSAAAAEADGFRPCLKCRPELAPGLAPADSSAALARRAALLIDEDPVTGGVERIAARLGITSRHLRRVFAQEYGVTPVRYLQTRRLLLAKNLLTDTDLSITDVAYAAGFGSIRRFNTSFREHYRMSPSRFHAEGARGTKKAGSRGPDGVLTLQLAYRPPFDFAGLLAFLEARCIEGVEKVEDGSYLRTVRLTLPATREAPRGASRDVRAHSGWLAVRQLSGRDALAVTLSDSLLPVLAPVLLRLRHLFDLDCEPTRIHEALRGMDALRPGLNAVGTRVIGCFDAFEIGTRAILGQQVTVKAARTLANRMAAELGEPLETPIDGLCRVFPSVERVAALPQPVADVLGPLGITGTRARAIRALAEALSDGSIELTPGADATVMLERLLSLPGFGPWTAHYVAMRALAWPDAFLHTDYGVKLALKQLLGLEDYPPPAQILELAEAWRPWRSYAAMNLWKSLGSAE